MWVGTPSTSIAYGTCGASAPAAQRPNGPERQRPPSRREFPVYKKDAGPKGPASQTGRLHVWETWDHEDPEFRTRKVENRSCRKPAPKIVGGFAHLQVGISGNWHAVGACLSATMQSCTSDLQNRVSATFRNRKSRNTAMRLEWRSSSGYVKYT